MSQPRPKSSLQVRGDWIALDLQPIDVRYTNIDVICNIKLSLQLYRDCLRLIKHIAGTSVGFMMFDNCMRLMCDISTCELIAES
jgi:hypothetical protein